MCNGYQINAFLPWHLTHFKIPILSSGIVNNKNRPLKEYTRSFVDLRDAVSLSPPETQKVAGSIPAAC